MHVLACTGHRPQKLNMEWNGAGPMSLWVQEKMRKILEEQKPHQVISGMALGADQIWAELAVIMNIPFIAAIPFKGQESKWSEKLQNKYRILLGKAKRVVNVSGEDYYKPSFMQDRNEWMVDRSKGIVAVWDGSTGGTFNCVMYAQAEDVQVFRINPLGFYAEPIDI
jgi:uncharacterized phage-like protein YoqJ